MTHAAPKSARVRGGRWRGLLARSDRALGDHLADIALSLRAKRSELAGWASLAGLPEGEVVASPFGARMIALGLEVGATTVQNEQRPLLPWHRSLLPEHGIADPLHGRWHHGALRTGKYQEFCQEDPFCTYHPEHSSKWAPHEWLHRAVGFFHAADASGFERYLGARLNELLPVATWYGLEHALRLDHDGLFDRVREGLEPAAPIERAAWLRESERALRLRARANASLVRWTLMRTASELAAIDEEIGTGQIVVSSDAHGESFPLVRLDASSDALAYVHAHGRRLSSPRVSEVLTHLAPSAVVDVRVLRTRVERVLDRLLFAPLAPSRARVTQRVLAGAVHDLFLRAATYALETRTDRALLRRARMLISGPIAPSKLEALRNELARALAQDVGTRRAEEITTLGLPHEAPFASSSTRALTRGLRELLPATHRRLGRTGTSIVTALAAQPPSRASLFERIARAITASPVLDAEERTLLVDLSHLEERIDRPVRHEPRLAWAVPLSGATDTSLVVRDARVLVARFATDVLAAHRGETAPTREVFVAIAHLDDGLRLRSRSPAAVALWRGGWARGVHSSRCKAIPYCVGSR